MKKITKMSIVVNFSTLNTEERKELIRLFMETTLLKITISDDDISYLFEMMTNHNYFGFEEIIQIFDRSTLLKLKDYIISTNNDERYLEDICEELE